MKLLNKFHLLSKLIKLFHFIIMYKSFTIYQNIKLKVDSNTYTNKTKMDPKNIIEGNKKKL